MANAGASSRTDDRTTLAARLLGLPATCVVVGLCIAMLLAWAPQYLNWPWWPDLDAYATMAQGWSRGLAPYRDVVAFNFPGQVYLFWLLGTTVGWGHTAPFYALDVALLLLLGGTLIAWGRARFGRVLPGAIAFAGVLGTYLNLDVSLVAQRDWQAPLLMLTGLLLIQARPGWAAEVVSALLAVLALLIRPHAVLFLPAIALALWRGAPDGGDTTATGRQRLVRWSIVFALGMMAGLAPLALNGLLDDFVRGVRQASYGSRYSEASRVSMITGLLRQLGLLPPRIGNAVDWLGLVRQWRPGLALVALVALAVKAGGPQRQLAVCWGLVYVLTLFYEPLHPKRHAYLTLPLQLVTAILLGVVAGLALTRPRLSDGWRLLMIGFCLVAALPGVPRYCRVDRSVEAIADLQRAALPRKAPAGAAGRFFPTYENSPYTWDDYRASMEYLRRATSPETLVANVLRNVPFPAFNGPLGRVSPLPAESGIIWLWSVDPDLEPAFAKALAKAPAGTVVLWDPTATTFDPRLVLKGLAEVIRRDYRREARFGAIEVWRKF